MNEQIARKFIDLVAKLYDMNDKAIAAMGGNTDEIETAFADYYWSDIKDAVNYYYVRKNDKTRPTIAKILAILETNDKVQKRVPDVEPEVYTRPKTKIWSIQGDFDRMIDLFIECGVIRNEDGGYNNGRSIIDPETDLPVLNVLQWFDWKLIDIERTNPDLFVRYPFATQLERLAIALGNHKIMFKVRDWAKQLTGLKHIPVDQSRVLTSTIRGI